jgi:hypothetical protein
VNAAAADLHLAAGANAVINRGRSVTGVTVDFDGNKRPASGAWDIGADEFVAPALTAPRIHSPQNGQQNVILTMTNGVTGVLIRWYAVTNATAYDVYFGTSSTPPKAASLAISGTTCTPQPCLSTAYPGALYYKPAAAPNTTYYWRIVAKNATGAVSGPTWSFKTAP